MFTSIQLKNTTVERWVRKTGLFFNKHYLKHNPKRAISVSALGVNVSLSHIICAVETYPRLVRRTFLFRVVWLEIASVRIDKRFCGCSDLRSSSWVFCYHCSSMESLRISCSLSAQTYENARLLNAHFSSEYIWIVMRSNWLNRATWIWPFNVDLFIFKCFEP